MCMLQPVLSKSCHTRLRNPKWIVMNRFAGWLQQCSSLLQSSSQRSKGCTRIRATVLRWGLQTANSLHCLAKGISSETVCPCTDWIIRVPVIRGSSISTYSLRYQAQIVSTRIVKPFLFLSWVWEMIPFEKYLWSVCERSLTKEVSQKAQINIFIMIFGAFVWICYIGPRLVNVDRHFEGWREVIGLGIMSWEACGRYGDNTVSTWWSQV